MAPAFIDILTIRYDWFRSVLNALPEVGNSVLRLRGRGHCDVSTQQ